MNRVALALGVLVVTVSGPRAGGADASPATLSCTVVHGGATMLLRAEPTADPYSAPNVDINGRFEFKMVWVNAPADEARVALYTYLPSDGGPVLLHELKYTWPLPAPGQGRFGFTGLQTVYEAHGRELQYWCNWSGA